MMRVEGPTTLMNKLSREAEPIFVTEARINLTRQQLADYFDFKLIASIKRRREKEEEK